MQNNSKITVLIVDDALFMRHILKKMFEFDGRADVIGEAASGSQAIKLAKELKPDLITMDIIMPDVDGITAVQEILKSSPQTKIVMMTSITHQHMVVKAIQLGAFDYMKKPVDDMDIKNMLDKLLNKREEK